MDLLRRAWKTTIGVALIAVMWIGWTAYVWAENGSTAGIGVLISWPAVLAAVTLVTAPFIGGAVAVRRHRAGEPVFAGAIAPAETTPEPAPEPATDPEPENAEKDDDPGEADDSGTDDNDSDEDEDEDEPA